MASQDDEPDEISRTVYNLRKWNPPAIVPDDPVEPALTPTAVFYDKHLPEQLSLKAVVGVPKFLHSLTEVVDNVVDKLFEDGVCLPDLTFGGMVCAVSDFNYMRKERSDAKSVAEYYRDTTAMCCLAIACTLLVPRMPRWLTFLTWDKLGLNPPEDEILVNYTLRMGKDRDEDTPVAKEIWDCLGDEEKKAFTGVSSRFPFLATWVILPPSETAQDIVTDIAKDCVPFRSFESEVFPVQGYTRAPIEPMGTVDSDVCLSFLPSVLHDATDAINKSSGRRRSSRLSQKKPDRKAENPLPPGSVKRLTLPGRRRYNAPFRSFNDSDTVLQHAWRKSVEQDTTFIIFHCGILECIGIRRRDSQTLYISPLIDVSDHTQDRPAYGDIHLNLYMAIFKDAVDRYHRMSADQPKDSSNNRKRKRAPTEAPARRSKRNKGPSPTSIRKSAPDVDVLSETKMRNVAFFVLRYGPFDSDAPAAFTREYTDPTVAPNPAALIHERKYSPHQYISITITSYIGHGAVGLVHGGTLDLQTIHGETLSTDIVVKLAFSDAQKGKLRHEVSIYKRLAASGVDGIPQAFGLFQDMADRGPLALVLSHRGRNLWFTRRKETLVLGYDAVETSEEERLAFLRILKDIHSAGVAHNDIRPENLLMSDDGQPTIIDFDTATLNPTRGAKKREREHLTETLSGGCSSSMTSYEDRTPFDAVFSDTDPEGE